MSDAPTEIKRLPPHLRRYFEVSEGFNVGAAQESDRGYALVAGSMLETLAGDLLEAAMPVRSKTQRDLLERGPLQHFGPRIAACYAFGLISRPARVQLDVVKKIRDKFAHAHTIMSFEHEEVKLLVGRLKGVFVSWAPPPTQMATVGARTRFMFAASAAATNLYNTAIKVRPCMHWPNSYDASLLSEDEASGMWRESAEKGKLGVKVWISLGRAKPQKPKSDPS